MKSFVRTVAASFVVVAMFSMAAACSSGDSGGSVAASSNSFVEQLCAEYAPCCAAAGKPADGAQCRAFYGAFTAGATYDPAAGSKCLEEIRAHKSSPTFCQDGMSSRNAPSCAKAFGDGKVGTAKPGETCGEDDDCAPSSEGEVECRSDYKDGTTIKKCQVQVVGKAGDSPCLGTVDGNVTSYVGSSMSEMPTKGYLCNVADGLRCDSATAACQKIPKVGEPCTTAGSYGCTKDAYCDATGSKVCIARKTAGQACELYRDQCADGTYCHETTKVCTTSLADGTACAKSVECLSESCVNGKCEPRGDFSTALLCGG